MAERRMFAKTIIDSDSFLDMPLSSQALYFHLSMRADDDGFINNPKKVQRMIGATEDDLRLLAAKNFIIPFQSGVVVIKHWRIHNYIRNDRYTETVYKEEKAQLNVKENKAYTLSGLPVGIPDGCQTVYQMDTQDRLGKDSIKPLSNDKGIESTTPKQVLELYAQICNSFPAVKVLSENRKKAIKARLNIYSLEDFKKLFVKAEASSFLKGANDHNWSATFDWLIKDANMAKVLEGNYDDKPKKGRAQKNNAFNEIEHNEYDFDDLERKLISN